MNEWHSESCLAYIQIASYLYSNSVLPTIQQKISKYATLNLDPGSWSKDRLQGRIGSFSSSKTSPRMFSWNSFIMGWKPYAFLKCWKTNKIQREYFKEEVPPKELRILKSGFQASHYNHSAEKSCYYLLSPPPSHLHHWREVLRKGERCPSIKWLENKFIWH